MLDAVGDQRPDVAGHRVVHGGESFVEPTLIDEGTLRRLEELSDLAPLHNPPAVAAIREVAAALPGVPQYAVFDTAFHHRLPRAATTYAVPEQWRRDHGVRRYGFHGLAHRWMAERAAALLARPLEDLRLVTLQLGSGCSAAAIAGGHSVDTSMGLTPAEGLVMATRSGDVDPLLVEHLARTGGGTAQELWRQLEEESGLLALAGDKDTQVVLERAATGDDDANLAIEIYCLRIRKYIGAYLAVLRSADAIVFGGGVGEHAPVIRERVLRGFAWAGIDLDADANERVIGIEGAISAGESAVAVLVCPVNEEHVICRDVAAAVTQTS